MQEGYLRIYMFQALFHPLATIIEKKKGSCLKSRLNVG